MKTKTAFQILLEAASLLENEVEWGQGAYFKFPENPSAATTSPACIMCAHGAIAYCGNPVVRDGIMNKEFAAPVVPAVVILAAEDPVYYTDLAQEENLTLEQWIAKHCNGNVGIAHYRAAKAGLTFSFNHAYGRTKQEVINKLREASITNIIKC